MNIQEIMATRYTLVAFTRTFVGQQRTDKLASREITSIKGADKGTYRAIKNIWPAQGAADKLVPELKAIKDAQETAYNLHMSLTSPFSEVLGTRLLNNAEIISADGYAAKMATSMGKMHSAINALEPVYDLVVHGCMQRLNGGGELADYPSFDQLRDKCTIKYTFFPVPSGDAFTRAAGLQGNVLQDLQASVADEMELAAKNAIKGAFMEVIDPLERMVRQTAPLQAGEKTRRIYDSLVENMEHAVYALKNFNLYSDPEIDTLRISLEKLIAFTPAQIKDSDSVKVVLHKTALDCIDQVNSIADNMGWME